MQAGKMMRFTHLMVAGGRDASLADHFSPPILQSF
jgi:hypothetical protein